MNEETQADIIREMRDLGAMDAQCNDMIPRSLQALGLRTYAGRLEAAAERELIQRDKVSFRCGDCARFGGDCDAGDSDGNEDRVACEKFVRRAIVPGNAAALREALTEIRRVAGDDGPFRYTIRDVVAAALAAPPRNCDVGTPEEQCLRFWRETEREPEIARSVGGFSRWAQLPYEAEGGRS